MLCAALAVVAAACNPFGGTEATPEICVDAWNRGTKDGAPNPEGSLDPSTAGVSYGFVGRRAAVVSKGNCKIVFDHGTEVYEFDSGSTGEPAPLGPTSPRLSGWLPAQDIQPPEYLDLIGGSWNACQTSDGGLVLLSEGSCQPLGPEARPPAIKEWLNRKAARNFVAGRESMPRNKAAFWLGPRFRGSVADTRAAHGTYGNNMPAGAAFEAAYFPWRGLRLHEWQLGHQRLRIRVLTYTRRLERLPRCLERAVGTSRCLEALRPLLRLEREGQTVIVVANANGLPDPLVEDIRRSVTSRPGYSEAKLEATEYLDSGISVGAPFGRRRGH